MEAPEIDYGLLFEQSPEVLLVLLPDAPRYTMVAATLARLRLTRTTAEQCIGMGLFELFPDNPDDPSATGMRNLAASLERVRATRQPDTMAVQKYDIRGPDGRFEVRYWSPKNLPVLSPDGQLLYILHRVEDVTELVRAGELSEEQRGRAQEMEREVIARSHELAAANRELREANAKLSELDAAKTTFFSNVSHEFRTPLTLLLGPLADALADRAALLPPAQRDRIELAQRNALRLLKLVNTLLDFARIEAGRVRASYAPTDLAQLTADLASAFRSAADRAGLGLRVECEALSGPAYVDREMWEKIVLNLLSNAFKFTFAGEIAVHLREREEAFELEVCDTGTGIPPEELPHIFERFHRVEGAKARIQEGSGIGLSLVLELVRLHGGAVAVRSEMDHGTVFTVSVLKGSAHLPAEAVAHGAPPASTASPVSRAEVVVAQPRSAPACAESADLAQAAAGSPTRGRILLVDDTPDLRDYMTALLAPLYSVQVAEDGQAALELIRMERPDLVVSDVMMPRLDGFGLLRALRDEPSTRALPIILLSARAGEEAAVEGLDAGADDYLAKPFSARELLARVRTHLELARAREACTRELERINLELEAFSYSVSHDLRAPLRAIHGFSEFLFEQEAQALSADGRRDLQRIRSAAQRMDVLIEAFLRLARLQRAEVQREPLDLGSLAAEVVTHLRLGTPERAVEVRIEAGLSAHADRALVSIVLENLLSNAWKFTAHADAPRITMGREGSGERAFFVRDNGAGFDPARAAKLFTPFHRLHSQSEFQGTGVGLATVQRIIGRHGGRIWAEAREGGGATFFFTLGAE